MSNQKNNQSDDRDEKQTTPKDSDVKQGDTKPVHKPDSSNPKYLSL